MDWFLYDRDFHHERISTKLTFCSNEIFFFPGTEEILNHKISNNSNTSAYERTQGKMTWGKLFKSGPSKIYGRQPLKHLKGYGLLKQTISLQIF